MTQKEKCRELFAFVSILFIYPFPSSFASPLLPVLKDLGQLAGDSVTHLGGLVLSTNVGGADVLVDDDLHSLVDGLGQLGFLQRVLEHHTYGEQHGDGVNDALARDVWCGACMRS